MVLQGPLNEGSKSLCMTRVKATIQHVKGESKSAFFWDYSGIGILGIDGICILLGAIPFSE